MISELLGSGFTGVWKHPDSTNIINSSITKPTISTDKSSYVVGETINISWIPSPDNSNLSHYWLTIDAPSGRVLSETMNLNTSYSYIPTEAGNYTFYTAATPKGSLNGEGSKEDSVTIVVSDANAPSNVELSKNQIWYDIQDTIVLNATSDNATTYWISVLKDGVSIINTEISGTLSFAASDYGYGEYHAWVSAVNSAGSTDSNHIDFSVVEAAAYTDVWSWKPIYTLNEIVSISVNTICAKGQVIGIDKNDITRVVTENCNPTYQINASELGVGKYSAYFSVYNGSGSIDTKRVTFYICEAEDLGSEFYAEIRNIEVGKYLTNNGHNVECLEPNGSDNQIWKFTKLSNGSYKLINLADELAMDVTDYGEAGSGTNIQMNSNWNTNAQQFWIYNAFGGYYFIPECKEDTALDIASATGNLQIWAIGSDWYPQKFDIEKVYPNAKITGDINSDRSVTISDAVLLQKYLLGSEKLTKEQFEAADINQDERVDVFDMVFMRKMLIS